MFEPSDNDRRLIDARLAQAANRSDIARVLLDQVLASDPGNPMAHAMQADILLERKDHAGALHHTGQALQAEPNFAPAWYQQARALWFAGRQAESYQAACHTMAIQPTNAEYRIYRAQLAAWLGYHDAAWDALAPLLAPHLPKARPRDPSAALVPPRLLRAEPPAWDAGTFAQALSALGELALTLGRFTEADRLLRRALTINPDLVVARLILGMNQLRHERYADGWSNYAARESVRHLYPDGAPDLPGTMWRGENLAGKAVLVFDDQGHGDSIQFFRLLPLLRRRGATQVHLLTFPGLERLYRQAAPWVGVWSALPRDIPIDHHCSSSALPRWLKATASSAPAQFPYLLPPLRTAVRLPAGDGPHVGLAWSGDRGHLRDHLRSIPAALFLRITNLTGIRFHSLQPEVRATDAAAVAARRLGQAIERAADFADTAALIARMDLVITVDTGIAHLAAAMGKPVWIILHVAADWRWLTERADSPWYPSVRLFRVRPDEWGEGDFGWSPVIDRVTRALRTHFAATPGKRPPRRRKASTAVR